MNKSKIEWCDSTWNPVTGCLHNCEYCYARRIANRFADKNNLTYVDGVKPSHLSNVPYPYGFMPTLHQERLNEPARKKKPQKIFVCSMADLFGDWVPDEWIEEVFKACEKAPWHTYLFLTKNPYRYTQLNLCGKLPQHDNFWYGTTLTGKGRLPFNCLDYKHNFISLEPILENVSCDFPYSNIQWVIIGAETGNRKGKVIPEKEWIESIVNACREADVPVFMKNSLKDLMGEDFIQEWPEGLR